MEYMFDMFIINLKLFFWEKKEQKERAKNGYCTADLGNIGHWFLDIMPKMLEDFNKSMHGYPGYLSEDDWDNIIKRMIFCFEEANKDTCLQKNEINYDTNAEEWFKREKEIDEYRNNMKNEGLELFSKYFWNFWG